MITCIKSLPDRERALILKNKIENKEIEDDRRTGDEDRTML